MIPSRTDRFLPIAAAAIGLGLALPAAAGQGQTTTVEAFSSWEARGEFYQTGPNEATFVGVLSGILYVEGADGSLEAGLMTCPARLRVDKESWAQTGTADCVILTPDGERVYGEFECAGTYQEGCRGAFSIVGGTGSREGITGGGPIEFDNAVPALTDVPGNMVTTQAIGLVRLPELTFRLP